MAINADSAAGNVNRADSSGDEFFNPLDPRHVADPDKLMRASRIDCPVARVSDILYTLNADADVRQVFDDTEHFSSRGNFTVDADDISSPVTAVTNLDPPAHTALRTRLLKNLAPAQLRNLAPQVDAIVRGAVGALPESGYVDLYADYADGIPAAVLYTLIGIPRHAWKKVQHWSDVVVSAVPKPVYDVAEFHSLTGYLMQLVASRRMHPEHRNEDVLDTLCFADHGEDDMSALEVVMHTFQLVVAATDTTRALIANCLFRLLEHHDQWLAVLTDRSLLPNAIEESLRLDSPAQFMVRSVTEDITISGCPITPGKKVYLNIQSANHDEQRWGADSLKYQVGRRNALGHLAFGRGIHACIGAPLARMEARAAVAAVLDKYPHVKLLPGTKWVKCEGMLVRRVRAVPVQLTGEEN